MDTTATPTDADARTLAIGGIGTRRGQWQLRSRAPAGALAAELDLPGLAAAYEVAVRDPLQADYPLLGSRLTLRGRAAGVIEQRAHCAPARDA